VPVKVITSAELGGLPAKGDISDWLAADPAHDRDALLNIIKETRQYVATSTGSAPKLMTVSEMQSRLGRHTDWLVDRMLALGDLSLLVAKPGVGKSTFAAQLAVAVAYGEPFLGRRFSHKNHFSSPPLIETNSAGDRTPSPKLGRRPQH
jgi:hypothetical protein